MTPYENAKEEYQQVSDCIDEMKIAFYATLDGRPILNFSIEILKRIMNCLEAEQNAIEYRIHQYDREREK